MLDDIQKIAILKVGRGIKGQKYTNMLEIKGMVLKKSFKAFVIPILTAITSANSKPDAVRIGIANVLGFLEHCFFDV